MNNITSEADNVNLKIGDVVYCIDERVYKQHITKRQRFEVVAVGSGTKAEKIRIKGNLGRLVWISTLHFSKINHPEIKDITIYDVEYDRLNDWVEVIVSFVNGEEYWMDFATTSVIQARIDAGESYFHFYKLIIIKEITLDTIKEVIFEMDRINTLREVVNPYHKE